jgi:hypothetical protein
VARVEQEVDLPPLPAGELVDRPRRDRRLPQRLDLAPLLSPPRVAQLAGQAIALADELARLERVEVIELRVEVVYCDLPRVPDPSLELEEAAGSAVARGPASRREVAQVQGIPRSGPAPGRFPP